MQEENIEDKLKEVEHEVNKSAGHISFDEADEEITGGLVTGE